MSEAADPHTSSADAVSEVVFRVRELPTLEHARAIEALCGCQPEVAEEVRRRLRVLELADQALGLTADSATLPHRDGEEPGPGVLPGYEVLGELGRGGMGVVYRARQTSLGREVAVKMILDATHAGEEEMGRFRREAEALARAQHPNIVQVFDIAGHGGRPFISLEYCAGGSLEKKLGGTPLRPREAAALVATLAGAMQTAHQAGVIHRDLKPANVLLAADGTPKISDFGLAKKLGEAGLTRSGALMGTPSYMAPEQAEGKKEVGPATDIYALGAILYECLTGRPPFRAATVYDTVLQVVNEEPVPPRQLNAQVPRDLETVALKCLRKEPASRYASAEELANDLRRWLEGKPIQARRAGVAERVTRWAARRPAVAALVAAVALVGAGGLTGILWQWDRAEGMAARERQARRAMRQTLYAAHLNLGAQAWLAGDLARVRELARMHLPEPGEEDLRGWEWYHLWQLGHADWRALGKQGRWVRSLSWSRDGERIATGGYDNVVRVWEAGSGRLLHEFDELHTDHIHRVAFDASGHWVASAADDGAVYLWDLNRRTGGKVYHHTAKVWAVAFLPDGRLVSADHNGEAFIHHRDGGAPEALPPLEPCGSVTCSPAGDVLAFGCDGGWVFLWDVKKKGGEWLRVSETGLDALSVAIDSAGKTLAVGGRGGMVQLWDLETRRKRHDLVGHTLSVWGLDFAPGGRTLVSASWDHRVRLWDVRSGGELATLLGHLDAVKHAAFSPRDGNRLATASKDGTVRLWKLPLCQGPVNLRTPGPVQRAWSVGGRLVIEGRDGVAAWRMSDGVPVAPPPKVPAGKEQVVALSPDGKTVAVVEKQLERDQESWGVRLKDAETGKPSAVGPLPANSRVTALAFAPDGRTLLAGDTGGGVKLWDPTSGMEKLSLTGDGAVVGLVFADDGRSLAVVREDGARLWFASNDDEVLAYLERAHEADPEDVETRIDLARVLAHRAATGDRDAGRRARRLLMGLTDRQCPQRQRWLPHSADAAR